jgi:hypothetical protein
MNTRNLAPLAWLFWGILVVVLLYGLMRVSSDSSTSPEADRGLGVLVVGALLVLMAIIGVLLYIAMKKDSSWGIWVIGSLVGYPVIMLIAIPVVKAYQTRAFEREYSAPGDFGEASLKPFADAIAANDTTTLVALLGGKAPPPGVDRAGNDLLAYSLVAVRDRRGHVAPVRVLLEAGADPRKTIIGETKQDVLNYMVLGIDERGREVVGLLLAHKADPNLRDPVTGNTPLGSSSGDSVVVRLLVEHGAEIDALQSGGLPPLVSFISQREWDSAVYLINNGARLDLKNADGLSVDYWLEQWKESVYGEHPEGWDRVRAAIAARR